MRIVRVVLLGAFVVLALSACNDSKLGSTGPAISVSPGELVFDPTAFGGSSTKVATVANAGHGVLTVDSLELSGAASAEFALQTDGSFPLQLGEGEWFAVQVTFAPSTGGAHAGDLTVFSNDAGNPAVVVPLVTTPIAPEIDATPNPMPFGVAGVGIPTTHDLVIANVGMLPLEVSSIALGAGTNPAFTIAPGALPVTIAALGQISVPVTFDAADESTVSGSIEIASDDSDEPLVVVPLSGVGTFDPYPDINGPSVIDFGGVQRQTCASRTVAISNVGSANLGVTGSTMLWGAGSKYTVTPTSYSVAPGGAQAITVTYCPQNTSGDPDQLRIASNDPDEAPFTITILGVGTEPPISETILHINLTWDKNLIDADVHLIQPGGTLGADPQNGNETDCGWWNQNPEWGAPGPADDCFLDRDDVDGYGPENINMESAVTGDYLVVIGYWGAYGTNGPDRGNDQGPTTVTVKVYLDGGPGFTTYTKTLSFHQRWDLMRVHLGGGPSSITMVDTMGVY